MKNNSANQKKSMRSKAIISFLFIVAASLSVYSQENDKSAVVSYGEHHPIVFIAAILGGVGILVLVVYLIFRKSIKEQKEAAKLPPPSGFTKGINRIGKNDDRRYGTHKTMHQAGGFNRR